MSFRLGTGDYIVFKFIVTLIMVLGLVNLSSHVFAQTYEKFSVNLPAQTLDRHMQQLAQQTDTTISYSRRALRKFDQDAIVGEFTLDESLQRLLKNTNYTYEFINDTTVRILKTKPVKKARVHNKPTTQPKAPDIPNVARPPRPQFASRDEIIVTADKRSRRQILQTVPYSVSVISRDTLKSLGVTDTQSLSTHIASVEMTNFGSSRNKMSIRGISDGAFNGRLQSTVGVYLNDTQFNYNAPYPEIPLIDIDNIEILRGPQGSLYGAGAIGGIYRITTKEPDLRAMSAWAEAGLASTKNGDMSTEFSAMVNMPIVEDKIGVRAVGYILENGGYIDDIRLDEEDVNRTGIKGFRGVGKWQVSPDWALSGGINYQEVKTDDAQYTLASLPNLQRENYIKEPHDDSFAHIYFNAVGDFSWGQFRSASSQVKRTINSEFDASLSLPLNVNRAVEPARFTELRNITFLSHETTATIDATDWLDVLVGGFIVHVDTKYSSEYAILGGQPRGSQALLFSEFRNDETTRFGFFGETDIKLNDKIDITLGLRWFDEYLNTQTLANDFVNTPVSRAGDINDNGVLPKINIGYKLTDNSYIYGLATTGFRVGGINNDNAANVFPDDDDGVGNDTGDLSIFEPDKIIMVELGGKTQWLSDRLTLNASMFFIDWRNIQTENIFADGFSTVLNAGNATNRGFDVEMSFSPQPNLDIQASLTINNPDIKTFNPILGPVIDDSQLPRIPGLSGGVVITYRRPVGRAGWLSTWSADYAYTGISQLSFVPSDELTMGGNHYLNARLNLSNEHWKIEAYIDNILDDKSNTFSFGNPFTFRLQQQVTPQRPRTAGLRVRKNF